VEGILRSAEEREGMTKEQVEENSGDLFWPERFSQSRFPEVPRTGICYIPIPNPPGFQEGEPEFNFETLSGIELDYLDKLMQVYTERGFYFPYFAVCGEFNVAAMQESAYTVDNIVEFYDACIRKVREYYPNSEVGVSMNNIYEYGEWYTPPYASKEVWDSKVASGVIVTNVDFIKRLSDIGCPFDFVSTEIHPGETDHYSFDFLKWYCDELIKVGKKLYLWEFWLVGTNIDNYPESFFTGPTRHIIPEGGKDEINENAQAEILSEFLDYIASNPDMMGFHSDAELRDGTPIEQYASGRVPVNFGYWREDHSIKPVYYVHLNWLKSIRYVKKLDIQQEDYSFEAVPGSFQLIYYDDSGNVNNIIFELNEENNTIELP
ncbi:MAG: hypothetical protein JW712_08040, partial [Dehalococcoidales bacterium]|nr:hypothetical protein [Dehalococcoidales bacterium]